MDSMHSGGLYAEQVRLLYRNAPLAYTVALINGAILAFVQQAYVSPPVVLGWFGSLLLVTAIRALAAWRYASVSPTAEQARLWGHAYVAGAAVAGVVWGAAALALFPAESMAHRVFVAFVLAGMAAGGVAVLAPRMEACLAFLLPALLPLILRYFTVEGELHTAMGVMTSIFLAGMLATAWTLHRSIRTSLTLRFDNNELHEEITQRRGVEQDLFKERDRLQTSLTSIGEGVVIIGPDSRIEYLNPAAEWLCGWGSDSALHMPVAQVFSTFDKSLQATSTSLEDSLHASGQIRKQSLLVTREGKECLIEELATALYDRAGSVVGAVSIVRDVTEALKKTEGLAFAANHDALTGLPNRNLLKDRTNQAIARAQRKNGNFALLFLDLDRFKAINDSMGHACGDALLKDVAKRLTRCVREEDTIARLGGDEFVVLLEGPTEEKQVTAVAKKVLVALRTPLHLGSRSATITASIGVSLYPEDGQDAEALLSHADAAMYRAKEQGRDRACR